MKNVAAVGSFILAMAFGGASAGATVLYQSIPDLSAPRFDSFCSNCPGLADQQSVGQIFSFGASATAKSLSFVVSNDYFVSNVSVWPTSVTVGIYVAGTYQDGIGTVGANVYSHTFSSFVSDAPKDNTDVVSVNLGSGVTLGSGNYIVFLMNSTTGLAIPVFDTGLGNGIYNYASTFPDLTGNPYASLAGQDIGVLFSSDAVSAVPEPSSWMMLLFGFAGIGFMAYRRNSKPALI
jgi:hypothetical protein